MESEDDLLNLLLNSPNSESIKTIAEQLEIEHNFSFSKDGNDLQGVWELRWSSSNSPFLKYSPFIDNLQILDPLNLNGLNLLKPRGIKSIIGTCILIRLNYINEKKIGVKFRTNNTSMCKFDPNFFFIYVIKSYKNTYTEN